MKLKELFSGIPVLSWGADPEIEAGAVSSDSRKIQPGDVFVCLRGQVFDGRKYVPFAFERGAVLAVAEEIPEGEYPYVIVPDPRAALPMLLSNFYGHPERSFQNLIGITGTNGKTTTSFMLKRIFEEAGHKTGLIGTTKYLVGDREFSVDKQAAFLTTPDPELLYALFDAMRREGCDTVIMETSSHALALRKLVGLPFDFGLFTNLTQDHIDFHKTMEEYLTAKKKLFQMAKVGVFNRDDPSFEKLTENLPCRVVSFGVKKNADYRATPLLEHSEKGIRYGVSYGENSFEVKVPIPGDFTEYNSLGALALASQAGIDTAVILRALDKMHEVDGRIQRVPIATDYSVFIDFAHTPDALENILKTLRGFTKGRLITLFGCGGDRDRTKRPIMGEIACKGSDFVIVTSDNSRSERTEDIMAEILQGMENSSCPRKAIPDRADAIRFAMDMARKDDVILLAGKGHEEYEIDQNGKHPFSERRIVLEYIGEK